MKNILVTGSGGLIGSEAVRYFCKKERTVIGVDNDMRKYFFGHEASTQWNWEKLEEEFPTYTHIVADIRNHEEMRSVFSNHSFELIIHTAAQPSHDWAAREPITDFDVNARGTLILMECMRQHCPEAVFIYTSTNKVYGDQPNFLPLIELDTRWELPADHRYFKGIDESMSIDQCLHSIFGASKVAADIMVQEYGKYFGLKTGVFRGGCLTGPSHSGAKLHGFLAYLLKCISRGEMYTILGYKGKQVRDNIHAHDVITAFETFADNPRSGEVYNIGGTRYSNLSIIEAIAKAETILNKKAIYEISPDNRTGDHIWYVTDMTKFKGHYPSWHQKYDADAILEEIARSGHFD